MTALPTIYITLYNRRQTESNQTCLNCRGAKEEDMVNRLTHNDLGGVFAMTYHRQRHITSYTEPSAGVRQGHRRKALCVYIIHN